LGVRGFRVDGAPFFAQKRERDEEEVHDLLHDIHTWAKGLHEETVLLPEANLPADELVPYAESGDAQMLFDFLGNQHIFLALATERAEPLQRMLELRPPGHDSLRWITFLRNQDELTLEQLSDDEHQQVLDALSPDPDTHIYDRGTRRRLAPMLDGDRRRMELSFSLLFALPGAPLFIAGDELGMGENLNLPERDAARLPMQWTAAEPNGGFSDAPPTGLVAPVLTEGPFGIANVNVEDQRADAGSFASWVRALIGMRKEINRWMVGTEPEIQIPAPSVFVLTYSPEDDRPVLVIAHNIAGSVVTLNLDDDAGVESRFTSERTSLESTSLELGPYGYAWWKQDKAPNITTRRETTALSAGK